MNIWDLIGRAYAAPFERWRAAVTVFWLPGVIWVVAYSLGAASAVIMVWTAPNDFAEAIRFVATVLSVVVFVILSLFQSITMVSGLVRWHQHLIAGEQPRSARLWLSKQECPYWWRWFYLGLLVFVLSLVITGVLMGLFAPDFYSDQPPKNGDLAFNGAYPWSMALAMALTGWLLPRTFLSLAAVAVGERQSFSVSARRIVTRADCSLLTLGLLATAAPFVLVSFSISLWSPEPKHSSDILVYSLASLASCLLDFLAMLVFASLLSLFYRARVVERRPSDEVPPQAAIEE